MDKGRTNIGMNEDNAFMNDNSFKNSIHCNYRNG